MRRLMVSFVLFTAASAMAAPVLPVETWQTQNGMAVTFVSVKELPILDLAWAFKAGSAQDVIPGQAALTSELLDQGTAKYSADALADAYADFGADYSVDLNEDMVVVSVRTLSDTTHRDPVIALFTETVAHPSLSNDAFQREQKTQLRAIAQSKQRPDWVADNVMHSQLYGRHPYAHNELGTEDSVAQLRLADVKAFHQRYFVAKNAVLAIVGDMSSEQAHQLAEKMSTALPTGDAAPALPVPTQPASACDANVNFNATQTNIRLAMLGIDRQSQDFYPMTVGNYVLGGGAFSSRLINELREKRGSTYAAYSYFQPLMVTGPYVLSVATRAEKAGEAMTLTKQTFEQFVKVGPTDQELAAAKSNLTGGFPLNLDSNAAIARVILRLQFYYLPRDYLDTYRDRMQAVTKEDVQRVFQSHFANAKICEIKVGQLNAKAS